MVESRGTERWDTHGVLGNGTKAVYSFDDMAVGVLVRANDVVVRKLVTELVL